MIDHKLQEEYLQIAESIELKEFPGYNIKQILFNETWYVQEKGLDVIIKTFILIIIGRRAGCKMSLNNNSLLFFSTATNRSDHDGYLERLKGLFSEYDELQLNIYNTWKNYISNIELSQIPFRLKKFFDIFKELKAYTNKWHRIYLSSQLLELFKLKLFLEKNQLKPKVAVCFFDSGFYENFAMQYLKKQGAVTITNQHSQPIFHSWDTDRLNQSQIINFKCDYYIAKGEFTREQFAKAGMDADKIVVLGGLAQNQPSDIVFTDKKQFGVFLDCPSFEFKRKYNLEMIQLAEQISQEIQMSYFVKIHPIDEKKYYKDVVGENCKGIYGKEKTISDTLSDIRFGLFHVSGSYLDMLNAGVKAFKWVTDEYYPLVSSEEDLFVDADDLEQKYQVWVNKTDTEKKRYLIKTRRYYNDYEGADNRIRDFVKTFE